VREREGPEQQNGRDRSQHRERRYPYIQPGRVEQGKFIGPKATDGRQRPDRQRHPQGGCGRGQRAGLENHLPSQPHAPRAQRGSHRGVPPAGVAPREQEVGDVEAGDHQQQNHRGSHRAQRAEQPSGDHFGDRHQARLPFRAFGLGGGQVERRHPLARLLEGHVLAEPREHAQPGLGTVCRDRQPQIRIPAAEAGCA
jgi:hypothetical protein